MGGAMMKVRINGENVTLSGTPTLLEILEQRGLDPDTVIIEHNLAVVSRKDFACTRLADDDSLEVLHFVGGG